MGSRRGSRANIGRNADGQFRPGHQIGAATRFRPGQSGNPSGRPKKNALDHALEKLLASATGKRGERSIADELALAIVKRAMKGNPRMAQLIAERLGGKPTQAMRFDGDAEVNPLTPQQRNARIMELLTKAGIIENGKARRK